MFAPVALSDTSTLRCAVYSAKCSAVHKQAVRSVQAAAHNRVPKRSRSRQGSLPRSFVTCNSASAQLQSETELFLEQLEETSEEFPLSASYMKSQLVQLESQVRRLAATLHWCLRPCN